MMANSSYQAVSSVDGS